MYVTVALSATLLPYASISLHTHSESNPSRPYDGFMFNQVDLQDSNYYSRIKVSTLRTTILPVMRYEQCLNSGPNLFHTNETIATLATMQRVPG